MAEGKVEPRELNWRQLLPWTVLFQGFRVALDPNKLLLAAAGILAMSFGWWLLSIIFHYSRPSYSNYPTANYTKKADDEAKREELAWADFKKDLRKWDIMHEAAGRPVPKELIHSKNQDSGDQRIERWRAEDFAASKKEADELEKRAAETTVPTDIKSIAQIDALLREGKLDADKAKVYKVALKEAKPSGRLRTLPWNEDRGPNPYLLVTGQAGQAWEKGHFWDWLLTHQLPVLVEPLVKLFLPVKYLFHSEAGLLTRLYAVLVILWTVAVWGFFGGAITRIAVVQVARQEKIGIKEALRFAVRKYLSFVSAPLFPLVIVAGLLVLMIIFGWLHLIPVLGELLDIFFWPVVILLGLGMAVLLVGLVGWPLMAATISAEGTDSWEAVSRSYSYVYQAPWQYLWCSAVALAYGAVVVFFVGIMGSLTVYLSKWGVSQTPGVDWANRNPAFLFVYAPKSFGWRTLLLQGPPVEIDGRSVTLVQEGEITPEAYDDYVKSFSWWNYPAAAVVSIVWVGLMFMLILGFGYSYFWSASTIIYLLMRRKVDDAEMDEVYLEEEEGAHAGPLAPQPAAPSTAVSTSLPVVEPPRPVAAPVSPPTPPPPAPAPPPPPDTVATATPSPQPPSSNEPPPAG